MKISALRLFNVKRFAGRGVALEGIGDGVNVLCAANEFGKSTSFEALHALFFLSHSSTAGDVRSLRPYAGGNPLVEADISTDAGRFRITKQFYGGRSARIVDLVSGRLVAQADEAENFIAGLIRGGSAGPAGLLWVRQGVTGIEKRSKSEEEGETRVRTSLLESVQGEVEAVTGGRRMADIMAVTDKALGEFITPSGRPKAGERYAAALEARERLEVEERRLGAEVTALREALDRRAAATRRLAELDRAEDRDGRRKAVDAAQAAYDAAKTQSEVLRATEAELRLMSEQRHAAERELVAFRNALQRAADLDGKLAEAGNMRREAIARRNEAAAAAASARAESDAAEAKEQETRALLARLDAAMKARESAERLADLMQRLDAAEAARKRIEDGEATVALVGISPKAVAELETVDVEIAKLKAIAEAGQPTVSVAYEPQAPAVRLDGEPLKDGETRSYEGVASLAVPGIGVITLRSNPASGRDERLLRAEERRRALLGSLGVDDLAAARRKLMEVQGKEGELRELKGRLSLLAPDGLAKLREEAAARRATAGDMLEIKEDPAQVRAAHEAAETARVAAQTALARLDAERMQVEAFLGPPDAHSDREHLLAERLASFEADLSEKQAVVDGLKRREVDLASAEAALRRVRSVVEAAEKEAASLREQIAGLTAEIRARSDDAIEENWREAADALAAAKKHAAAYEKEVAVLQRLRAALDTSRSHARETYLLPVMTELRPLLGLLFDDVSITFDEKTLLPHKILRNGQEEDVERLSGGMREQLSVLTRLAFARLLAKDGRPTPVILDDALVYSDDDRIEKMFDALHRQARDQQIIVFSCRQRAFQALGGNVLQMEDWVPGPTT